MGTIKEKAAYYTLVCMFFTSIILISCEWWVWLGVITALVVMICLRDKRSRLLSTKILFFIVGFAAYHYLGTVIKAVIQQKEYIVLLDRLLLVVVIVSLWIHAFIFKQRLLPYFNKPEWGQRVYFPYIWRGFHSISALRYLVIAIACSLLFFIPFSLWREVPITYSFIWFSLLFAITNGLFEEMIWRSSWLGGLQATYGTAHALFISCIGFGLQHMSIGTPFTMSILFSLGGFFFSVVVLKTNSIYPAVIWHILINLGMVYSGFII